MRPSVALIYTAIAVISACGAAVLHRLTPMTLELAVFAGAVLFFALATLDQAAARRAERKQFQDQLNFFEQAQQDSFNEIDMVRSRLVALETDTQQTVDQAVAPLMQDLQAIGALLAQVTEAVADTDHRLMGVEDAVQTLRSQMDSPTRQTGQGIGEADSMAEMANRPHAPEHARDVSTDTVVEAAPPSELALTDAALVEAKRDDLLNDDRSRALLKRVRMAVDQEHIEVALQSIVTLPHRRARAYATIFNLKLDGAGTLAARHAIPAIEAAGVSETFDKAVVQRALALADRFAARDSASMVFVPITGSAIMGIHFSDWLVERLSEEKELAGRLVLEFAQKDVRAFTPLDFDLMGTLADLGYRMSVSQLSDVRSDLFDLSSHGFRYAKAPVSLFLGSQADAKSDIHPEDLSDLAARNGMDLIVDQVETEGQLVELLDCKLKYAQGNLFARPRIVDVQPRPEGTRRAPVDAREALLAPMRSESAPVHGASRLERFEPSRDEVRGVARRAATDPGDLAAVRPTRSLSRSA